MKSIHRLALVSSVALLLGCQPADPQPPATAAATDVDPAVPAQTAAVEDWTLPGEFAPDTTPEALRARFGEANVRIVDDLPLAEGETTRGLELFANDPTRRALVYFQDEQRLRGLSAVAIDDVQSRWRFASGVQMGMTLDQLVAVNGAPVTYYGLSWDYGGHVADWNGGKLETVSGIPGRHIVRLAPAPDAAAEAYPEGDTEYRSDDKRWPAAGKALRVGELVFNFPGQDDL